MTDPAAKPLDLMAAVALASGTGRADRRLAALALAVDLARGLATGTDSTLMMGRAVMRAMDSLPPDHPVVAALTDVAERWRSTSLIQGRADSVAILYAVADELAALAMANAP